MEMLADLTAPPIASSMVSSSSHSSPSPPLFSRESLSSDQEQGSNRLIDAKGREQEMEWFVRQGARALEAFCRPYVVACVGRPVRMSFDMEHGVFELDVKVDDQDMKGGQLTEVYVPFVHYGGSIPGGDDGGMREADSLVVEDAESRLLAGSRKGFMLYPLKWAMQVSAPGEWWMRGQTLCWKYPSEFPSNGALLQLRITRA